MLECNYSGNHKFWWLGLGPNTNWSSRTDWQTDRQRAGPSESWVEKKAICILEVFFTPQKHTHTHIFCRLLFVYARITPANKKRNYSSLEKWNKNANKTNAELRGLDTKGKAEKSSKSKQQAGSKKGFSQSKQEHQQCTQRNLRFTTNFF